MDQLTAAADMDAVFALTATFLKSHGIDGFNYFNTPLDESSLAEVEVEFHSNLRLPWLLEYKANGFEYIDHLAQHYRQGHTTPVYGGPELLKRIGPLTPEQMDVLMHGAEAGLKSGISIPMCNFKTMGKSVAGFTLCSEMAGGDFLNMMDRSGMDILFFLSAVHQHVGLDFVRERHAVATLTDRETDCMTHLARGKRIGQIGYQCGISDATVSFHLRNAKHKLKAPTLSAAVARALKYGLIQP